MLTLQELKDMKPDTIFATGITTDNPAGINMTNSGQDLRWVACRGGIHDWAIYVHWAYNSEDWIRDHGDKIFNETTIKRLVPCDAEAFGMYRW